MQPLPVPMSATLPPLTRAIRRSTSPSVSGRGMSAGRSTRSFKRRKPAQPVTYASGSPAARRSTAVRKALSAAGATGRFRSRNACPGGTPRESAHSCWASRRGSGTPPARSRVSPSASSAASVTTSSGTGLLLSARHAQRLYQGLDVAVENVVEVVDRQVDPMIRDAALGEIVRPDLGRAIAGAHHRPPLPRASRLLVGDDAVEQPGPQHLQGLELVLQLRFLILLLHDQAGREVGDAHGAVGGIY